MNYVGRALFHTDPELETQKISKILLLLVCSIGPFFVQDFAYLSNMASDIFSCVNQARLLPGIPNELRWQGSVPH